MTSLPIAIVFFLWSIIGVTTHKAVVARAENPPPAEDCIDFERASMYTPPSMLCEGKKPTADQVVIPPPWTWAPPSIVGEPDADAANVSVNLARGPQIGPVTLPEEKR